MRTCVWMDGWMDVLNLAKAGLRMLRERERERERRERHGYGTHTHTPERVQGGEDTLSMPAVL